MTMFPTKYFGRATKFNHTYILEKQQYLDLAKYFGQATQFSHIYYGQMKI